MTLQVLSSSSAGNCYILSNQKEALIVECGVKVSSIVKALDYNIAKVSGCLCTHEHKDHSKYVADLADLGVLVLALPSVIKSSGISGHHRVKEIGAGKGYVVGRFKVFAFSVAHDVPCVGFVITHEDTGSMLFLTDTFTCDYRFDNLTTIMIEANYSDDILNERIGAGKVMQSMRRRLLYSHMELETTKHILLSHDLSSVNNIVLLHLSSENSNASRFKEEISAITGKSVYVADKGLEIGIGLMPY